MIVHSVVKPDTYVDSVTLMAVQSDIRARPGVREAGLVLGTEANKALLREAGLATPEGEGAGQDDLVISVGGDSDEVVTEALRAAERLLTERRGRRGSEGVYRPRTIAAARRMFPQATIAAVSVPGRFAGGVAREALLEGLHVFLFSDNVPLETEVELKRLASERGLLVMGPDCGTALLGGIGLGFANRVRRGTIGLVAAAGTGLQEVSSLIHRFGGGVSHGLGTGSRDVSAEVGGATMLRGIAALAEDVATTVIVVVAKPPHPQVAARILRALRKAGKPAVVAFVGTRVPSEGNIHGADTLESTAATAVRLALGTAVPDPGREALPAQEAGRLSPQQQYLRGLFSGGTLCGEAQVILRAHLGRIYSNAPLDAADGIDGIGPSREHTVLDLGVDEFTQGRLHPMIDPTLRLMRMAEEAAQPEVGVLLLDVVLGYGADRDPARTLAPAVSESRRRALESGRYLVVVGSLVGTDEDPQDLRVQEEALLEAGMVLQPSNARAAHLAGLILEGRGQRRRRVKTFSKPEPLAPPLEFEAPNGGIDVAPITGLLDRPPAVINVGLELFAESLREQGVPVVDLDWQPPAGGKQHLIDLLSRLEA